MATDSKAADKGPDNNKRLNKRLASLEASSSAIAAVLVAASLMPADSAEDPLDVAKVELERLGKLDLDNASLSAFLLEHKIEPLEGERAVHAAMRKLQELEDANGEGDDLAAELDKLKAFLVPDDRFEPIEGEASPVDTAIRLISTYADGAEAKAEASGNGSESETVAALVAIVLEEQVRSLTEDLDAARAEIAQFNSKTASAHRKGPRSAKARKANAKGNDSEAIGAAMKAGEELEIVFSNGDNELVELDPVRVFPPAFSPQGSSRYALREAILVKGTGAGQRVRGAALFAEGKQIGYCAFPRTVELVAGQEMRFHRMIVFG